MTELAYLAPPSVLISSLFVWEYKFVNTCMESSLVLCMKFYHPKIPLLGIYLKEILPNLYKNRGTKMSIGDPGCPL